MKTDSIGKSLTIEKILKIDFQYFDISWNPSKSISWTFLGSLHNETIVGYVFHEILWKKYFTVYPRLKSYAILSCFWITEIENDPRRPTHDNHMPCFGVPKMCGTAVLMTF